MFITGAAHTAGKKVNSEACTDGWVADGTAGNGGEEMAEVGSDGAGVIVGGPWQLGREPEAMGPLSGPLTLEPLCTDDVPYMYPEGSLESP